MLLIWTSGCGTIHRDDWLETLIKGNSVEGLKQWVHSENKEQIYIPYSLSHKTESGIYSQVVGQMTVACLWPAFILRHLKLPTDKSSRTHIWYIKSQEYFFTWVEKSWSQLKLLLSLLVFRYPKFTLKSKSNDMLRVTRSLERCFTTRIGKKIFVVPMVQTVKPTQSRMEIFKATKLQAGFIWVIPSQVII